MADRAVRSDHEDEATSQKYSSNYQSPPMAQWMRVCFGRATPAQSHQSSKDNARSTKPLVARVRAKSAIRVSNSIKGPRGVSASCNDGVVEETVRNLAGQESETICSFPMFNVSQHKGKSMVLPDESVRGYRNELLKSRVDLSQILLQRGEDKAHSVPGLANPKTEASSGECSLRSQLQIKLSPAQDFPPSGKPESFSLPRWPCSVKQMEAMRMHAVEDRVQEVKEGPSKFSETTQPFLFTRETALNVTEEVKLERPDSEGRERIQDNKSPATCKKNESSAETDVLDIGNFQPNRNSGLSSSSDKTVKGKLSSSASQATVALAFQDIAVRPQQSEIPDINKTPLEFPDRKSSLDTSRTQSMNIECLLPNPENQKRLRSRGHCGDHSELEPTSRWMKRLKMSASESIGQGTKNSGIVELLPYEKTKVFHKIVQCGATSSGVEPVKTLVKRGECSLSAKNQAITLSHPWIHRWCQNKVAKAVVVSEPVIPKGMALDVIEKKQFPSLAAMALMGKAMNGFTPSNLRKRGSLIVWNTRDFR